jgi:hypothetical protein
VRETVHPRVELRIGEPHVPIDGGGIERPATPVLP